MAALAPTRATRASAAILKRGQKFYEQKKYRHAEKAFLQAMNLCMCGVAIEKEPCIADDILASISQSSLKDGLSKLSASSKRCDNQVHVDSIDCLIATYEQQNQVQLCLSLAAKMVNLCPREPKAYLRLGKILRLKQNPVLAYLTYKQGIELVQRKNPNHVMLPKLHSQCNKIKALAVFFDPITILPIELVRHIFKLLDFKTLCRSLRVSRTWKAALTTRDARDLWSVQSYNPFRSLAAPSSKALERYARYANGAIHELYIDGLYFFMQKTELSKILSLSQSLKILKAREQHQHFGRPIQNLSLKMPLSLTVLYLGRGLRLDTSVLTRLVNACAGSLQELSIFEIPECRQDNALWQWYDGWPKLESLKVVRVSCYKVLRQTSLLNDPVTYLSMSDFVDLAPNVEVVWFDYLRYDPRKLLHGCPKLRSIFIGGHASMPRPLPKMEVEVTPPEDLRELHLEESRIGEITERLGLHVHSGVTNSPPSMTSNPSPLKIPQFRKLEKLSLLSLRRLSDSEFEYLVRPSMESGTLRELDVRPLPLAALFDPAQSKKLDWFKSEAITFLSLTGFSSDNLHQHKLFDEVMSGIFDRFPNLKCIDVSTEVFPDSVLANFVARGAKKIHYRQKNSVVRADLREWARKHHGADIIGSAPPNLPSMHPDRGATYNGFIDDAIVVPPL